MRASRRTQAARTGIVAVLLTMGLVATAGADHIQPSVTVTSPAAGAEVSRAQPLEVTGTAVFGEPVQEERTFYLQRNQCASGNDDARLALDWGSGQVNGCTFLAQPLNEVLILTGDEGLSTEYGAVEGVPFTLDASEPVTGRMVMSGFATAGVGVATLELRLYGSTAAGQQKVIGETSEDYVVAVSNVTVDWEMEPAAELDQTTFSSLTLWIRVRGVNAAHGGINHNNGSSRLTIGVWDPSPHTAVQLSFNQAFPRTQTTTVAPAADGSWAATLSIGGRPLGENTLFARADQGGVRSDIVELPLIVTN